VEGTCAPAFARRILSSVIGRAAKSRILGERHLAPEREAKASEADEHHGPGGGLRNAGSNFPNKRAAAATATTKLASDAATAADQNLERRPGLQEYLLLR
jgi:hypothetical protein